MLIQAVRDDAVDDSTANYPLLGTLPCASCAKQYYVFVGSGDVFDVEGVGVRPDLTPMMELLQGAIDRQHEEEHYPSVLLCDGHNVSIGKAD